MSHNILRKHNISDPTVFHYEAGELSHCSSFAVETKDTGVWIELTNAQGKVTPVFVPNPEGLIAFAEALKRAAEIWKAEAGE